MGLLDKIIEKCNCDICGDLVPKIFMHTLYDGTICSNCFNKIGKEKYEVSLSVKNARQRILLYEAKKNGEIAEIPPYPYNSVEEYTMELRRDKYIHSKRYHQLSEQYYTILPKIDTKWSILYNTKDFNGKTANSYEKLCLKSINTFKQIHEEFCIPNNTIEFTCIPAYKRLAMLYEKQKKYDKATYCVLDAIQHGAPNEYGDGGSGKMYARLARLAKKAGILEKDEIKGIVEASKN